MFNKTLLVILCAFVLVASSGPVSAHAAGPAAVNLQSAGNFVILTKTGISTTGVTSIVGDIGVSPAAATFITGFGLSLTAPNTYSTSPTVTGKVYAADYSSPTPSYMTTAISDMQTAYTDAAGLTNPTATELGAGNIGGLTIAPGLYKWGTGVTIPTDVTLSGGANDIWIFQIAQGLNISSSAKVVLAGGARAANIFWVVAGQTTIGTGASFNGNILDQTAIVLNTGATLTGRALAQTAVTLDANVVTTPGSASTVVTPPVVPVVPVTPPTTVAQPVAPVVASSNQSSPSRPSSGSSAPTVTAAVTTGNTTQSQSVYLFGQAIRSIALNLHQGDSNEEVGTLQQFLIAQHKGSAAAALATVGPTGYFGAMTRAALAEFQAAVSISPALGNFGPITRAYLSAHAQ